MPDDFDPTQLSTTTLDYPNMPQQAPPEMVPGVPAPPAPTFQDQFEQKILQQLGMTRDDFIKKKLEEDRKTKKQKFFTGLGDVLGTLGSSREHPFVTSLDKAKAEGGAEYDKLQPQLRQEANTIYQNKTSEANAQTKANATTQAAQTRAASAETIAKGRQEIDALKAKATANNLDARTLAEQEKAKRAEESYRALNEFIPGFDKLPKEQQELMGNAYTKSVRGEQYVKDLEDLSSLKNVTNPTKERALFGLSKDAFDNYESRYGRLKTDDKNAKFAPQPRAGGSATSVSGAPQKYMQYNPQIKQMEQINLQPTKTPGLFYNSTTGMPQDMSKVQPYEPATMATDKATSIGLNQAYMGMNDLLSMMAAPPGTANSKVLGPIYGNALAGGMRAIDTIGQTFEEANKEISTSNVALQHTKSLVGARPPAQIVADIKNSASKKWESAPTQLNKLGSMLYSIQDIQLTNRKDPRAALLNDPRITKKIDQALDDFQKQALDGRNQVSKGVPFNALKMKPLKSLEDILDDLAAEDTQTPKQKAKTSLFDEINRK